MEEIWKDIQGYEGLYQVSNLGRVKSLSRKVGRNKLTSEIIMKPFKCKDYLRIKFQIKEKQFKFSIHRLVAQAFIPNPENLPQVNHKDGNKSNNNVENLEWVTAKENVRHSYNVLKRKHYKGDENWQSKPVIQYDMTMRKLYEYGSVREASRITGFPNTSISACCRKEIKKSHGYIWRYKEE